MQRLATLNQFLRSNLVSEVTMVTNVVSYYRQSLLGVAGHHNDSEPWLSLGLKAFIAKEHGHTGHQL